MNTVKSWLVGLMVIVLGQSMADEGVSKSTLESTIQGVEVIHPSTDIPPPPPPKP